MDFGNAAALAGGLGLTGAHVLSAAGCDRAHLGIRRARCRPHQFAAARGRSRGCRSTRGMRDSQFLPGPLAIVCRCRRLRVRAREGSRVPPRHGGAGWRLASSRPRTGGGCRCHEACQITRPACARDRPVLDQPVGRRTWRDVWQRQARWASLRRASFPFEFTEEIRSFPWIATILAALAADTVSGQVAGAGATLAAWYGQRRSAGGLWDGLSGRSAGWRGTC